LFVRLLARLDCLLARLARKTSAPARQGNIEYIRIYSSIFKYIRGIFKEYLENMSNTPSSCPA
jgi:hypothetical protein